MDTLDNITTSFERSSEVHDDNCPFGHGVVYIDRERNEFTCSSPEKAAYVVIEVIDVFPDIKYAYQTPGIYGGITIVVNRQIQTYENRLKGRSGWKLNPLLVGGVRNDFS